MRHRDTPRTRATGTMALLALTALLLVPSGPLPCTDVAAGEDISTELAWTRDDSPVVLSASMEIAPDARLTIGPGVEVRLDEGVGIQVKGELRVEGTQVEPVLFVPNITGPVSPKQWADVRLLADSAGHEHTVSWAVFRGADSALVVNSADLMVTDSVFDTCRYGILSRADAHVDVYRSTFHNNSALGLEWQTGADGTAYECTFTENVVGLYCFEGVSPNVVDCTFRRNYHHLSFAKGSNATVTRCLLENATAEHLECYWNSSPLLEDVTIVGEEDARVFLSKGSRPRFLSGTSLTKLRVDTMDSSSYAVAVTRITIEVVDDDGIPLQGANVTIRGASGDELTNGTTGGEGQITGGLMALFTSGEGGVGDVENPHMAYVSWEGHNQTFRVDPRDLTSDRVLRLELVTSSPEPGELPWYTWVVIVVLLVLAAVILFVLRRRQGTA